MRNWSRPTAVLVVATVVLAGGAASAGASPSSSSGRSGERSTSNSDRKVTVRPATLEGPITVGQPSPPADARPVDLPAIGYTQEEFFASGTATAYSAVRGLPADGKWRVTPASTAPYKTRLVVRRPSSPSRFNGTVVVEWLNVTVVEADPEWAYTSPALVDDGAAWVGVSVQALGIMGGTSAIQTGTAQQAAVSGGLRNTNPERYGSLTHPGDQYAFDIYSQVATALRSPGKVPVLGRARARRIIAAGESQSAGFLTTYINAIQPVTHAFDGFFVHSRGAGAAHLDGTRAVRGSTTAYRLRPDLDVPVMVFETETDVGPLLRYATARQPDLRRLRVWETAGTSHADSWLVGKDSQLCPGSKVNDGPHHYVATAAMGASLRWVEHGTTPPHSDRIRTAGEHSTTIVRDRHGIALGGIRTPSVDVPVETLSGESKVQTAQLCPLFGSTTLFDPATLSSLYPSRRAYLHAFDKALDRAIGKGFVRRADRSQYAAEARAFTFPG